MEHSLEELVRRHNLELVDVPGDGNCQFHAISHQLTTRYPRTCPSGTYTHKFVRLLAVNGVENMRGEQQSVFRGELIRDKRNKLDENASYGTCLEKLGKDGTWGNHVTLQAIAHQLKDQVFKKDVKIVVYNTMGSPDGGQVMGRLRGQPGRRDGGDASSGVRGRGALLFDSTFAKDPIGYK